MHKIAILKTKARCLKECILVVVIKKREIYGRIPPLTFPETSDCSIFFLPSLPSHFLRSDENGFRSPSPPLLAATVFLVGVTHSAI